MSGDAFDYVVVGAGSAGCVLAHRLTEDPDVRVLLLEAGGRDWNPLIHIPLGVGKMWQKRMHDWGYDTEPEPNLNDRRIEVMRGKVLGGSSSINFMAHIRGVRGDYDRWARASGLGGWSYENLLPYFKRTEAWLGGAAPHRGAGGPIGVTYTNRDDPLAEAVLEAARAAGLPIFDDVNSGDPQGFGFSQATIAQGRRMSAAVAYLRPIQGRSNLKREMRALATRILFDGQRAVGVEYLQGGVLHRARAERELILSGGAINSPQLLMLSGIGDAGQLRPLGIDVKAHLPGVGANLQDHLAAAVTCWRKGEGRLAHTLRADRIAWAMLRAYLTGEGPATELPGGLTAVVRSRPDLDGPDLQFLFRGSSIHGRPWMPVLGRRWRDAFSLRAVLLHPRSRGTVSLVSADPLQKVRIQPRFLSAPGDLETLCEGVRIARTVLRQTPLDSYRDGEWTPGAHRTSDEEIAAFIREAATTAHHPACTCRMGEDEFAVVDPALRVRGVECLRVVDASVMPDLVSGNINACVLAIAERASDLISGKSSATSAAAG